jgi:hypothetical protein
MSMYADLLSHAPVGRLEGLTDAALVAFVVVCRAEMLASQPYKGASAYDSLANEVAYDRALLKLCAANDIEVGAGDFSHPAEERHRLEHRLADAGLDLVALAKTGGDC